MPDDDLIRNDFKMFDENFEGLRAVDISTPAYAVTIPGGYTLRQRRWYRFKVWMGFDSVRPIPCVPPPCPPVEEFEINAVTHCLIDPRLGYDMTKANPE